MSDKAWEELIDLIETRFGIESHQKTDLPIEGSNNLTKNIEEVVFCRNGSKYKVERVISPAIIDKKTIYHRNANATSIQYIYDDQVKTHKVFFYRQIDQNWQEIPPQKLLN